MKQIEYTGQAPGDNGFVNVMSAYATKEDILNEAIASGYADKFTEYCAYQKNKLTTLLFR